MSAALASNVVAFPGTTGTGPDDDAPGPDIAKFRKQFADFASVKTPEINEQREAWAYYYGDQIPPDVLRMWERRGQPTIVFPIVDTVADGATGVIAEMRGDPKAYPRTPNNEEAAEVATQCVRAVLDESDWATLDTEAIRRGYVGGISVAQIEFVEGDYQDDDVRVSDIDPTTFFYDPRSVKPDFSDARFMGVSKWCTADDIEEMFPGTGDEVQGEIDSGETTAFDSDREQLWVQTRKRIRLVEHWYKERGEWLYAFYAGSTLLTAGVSPHKDERGQTICRFFAVANRIDQKGVHHGFHRRLKGAQDSINQTRSRGQHLMNSRTIKAKRGGKAQDTEEIRREVARADGVILYDMDPNEVQLLDQMNAFTANMQFYEQAMAQLTKFGPTQAAIGDGGGDMSGRAMAMLMRAGMAQLGPFITNHKDWRLRIYRAIWAQVKNAWTTERMIRVTGDDQAPQFLAVNRMVMGPMGVPQMTNALSAMNVDIIADEGPNTVNVMADVFDLMTTLAQNKVPIPPEAIIEMSGLPGSIKNKLIQILSQPDPMKLAANQAQLANKNADTAQKNARAAHQTVLAQREEVGAHLDVAEGFRNAAQPALPPPGPPAGPMPPQQPPAGPQPGPGMI